MRSVKGDIQNASSILRTNVYGRVAACMREEGALTYLLQLEEGPSSHLILYQGHAAITGIPAVRMHGPLDLAIGDIVQVSPRGTVRSLIKIGSTDNALFFTEVCNSSCLMCPQPPRSQQNSYLSDMLRIVGLLQESPSVLGITGGEPTVFFEDLLLLIQTIRERHPDCLLHILTNARVLKCPEKTARIIEATDGHALFCVPLYSDDETTHNYLVQRDAFWDTMTGLYNLGRHGAALEIRNVLIQQTVTRLRQYSHFIYHNLPFAEHVAFMGMEPIGNAAINFSTLWPDPAGFTNELADAVLDLHMRGMRVSIYNLPQCLLPSPVWDFAVPAISEWKIRYTEACDGCTARGQCGGMFFSAIKHLAPSLKSITS